MNGRGEQNNYRAQVIGSCDLRAALAVLLIGAAAASTCRADSQARSAPASRGPLSASAHLDFRVTVLPSLALSMQAQGAQVRGNAGVLTVQSSRSNVDGGAAPSSSLQLRPRNLVVDTALPRSSILANDVVTIASP